MNIRSELVKPVVAKTENQKRLIKSICNNTLTLCAGPAGSGKTCVSIGMAANLLNNGKFEKIILTRPVVESGGSIGFLPGTTNEKIFPFLIPLFDELKHFVADGLLKEWQHGSPNKLEIIPLNFMRGRTFNNSIIIADELGNATAAQLKLLLTRLGQNSKIILNGDVEQTDLPDYYQGGFKNLIDKLGGLKEVGICTMTADDIVRNSLIGKILERLKT